MCCFTFRQEILTQKDQNVISINHKDKKERPWGVVLYKKGSGGCLSSRAVSSQVLSVYVGLTAVFGMRTGGSPQLNHRKAVLRCKTQSVLAI